MITLHSRLTVFFPGQPG